VYLVRTPQPIFGTTHHVLKRIAVANAAMLEEVKKEVDIMVSYTSLYICFTIG
jgi:AP2-associated kinase